MSKPMAEQAPGATSVSRRQKMARAAGWAPYLAEGLGTFALVFAGCGAVMIDALSGGQVTHVGVGLVFGLVIMVMIYALGHISGAHFNPAFTLGFVLARHFLLRRLAGYWTAQLVGAVLASTCLRLLLGNVAHVGATLPAGSGGAWQSFGLEALLTFFLMFVIMAMATDTRAVGQAAAIAIGATVGLEALFAGPISGASMNPARSLGPALLGWTWSDQWVYVLAPLVGAAGGAFVYRWLREASGRAVRPEHAVTQEHGQGEHEERETMNDLSADTQGTTSNTQPVRVLFLCTHNSSRSQMAEGLLRARGGKRYEVFSAGTHPLAVHPLAIKAMAELGIDISEQAGHRAKGIEAFEDASPMDLVVTVCDEAAEECPYFPRARRQQHWGFPDPSKTSGSEQERLAVFRQVRDAIAARIEAFVREVQEASAE